MAANMDDLEIHDERRHPANSCFSLSPVFICRSWSAQRSQCAGPLRSAEVTGKIQHEIVTI